MKNYKQKIFIILSITIVVFGVRLHAKVRAVQERRHFEQYIAKNRMVVILFYRDEKRNRKQQNKDKGLMKIYEDVSAYQPYNDADIIFLKANINREPLNQLSLSYNVTSTPTFMLIYKGVAIFDENKKPLLLTGFVSRDTLRAYINTYYDTEIRNRIEIKDEQKKRRLAQENESWKPYFYPRDMFISGYDPDKRDME